MKIANIVEKYIDSHQCAKDSLKKGLINYSALARQIIDDLKLKKEDFDAILIGCRRYKQKTKDDAFEAKVKSVIKNLKLTIKNKITGLTFDKNNFFDIKEMKNQGYLLLSSVKDTIFVSQDESEKIEKELKSKWIEEKDNLALLSLKNDEAGLALSTIFTLFQNHKVEILSSAFSGSELDIIIDEKDLSNAIDVLRAF